MNEYNDCCSEMHYDEQPKMVQPSLKTVITLGEWGLAQNEAEEPIPWSLN